MKALKITFAITCVYLLGSIVPAEATSIETYNSPWAFQTTADLFNLYTIAEHQRAVKNGTLDAGGGTSGGSSGALTSGLLLGGLGGNAGYQLGNFSGNSAGNANGGSGGSGGSGGGSGGNGGTGGSNDSNKSSGIGQFTAANTTINNINVIGSTNVQITNTLAQSADGSKQTAGVQDSEGNTGTVNGTVTGP
jgi:hypothetical protein